MKKTILLFLVFCGARVTSAQTSRLHLTVLSSEGRNLYVGFDNQVKLYVDSLPQKKLIARCNRGSMSKSIANDSIYIFKFASGVSEKVEISVYEYVNDEMKTRGTEVFTLKAIDPTTKFEKGRFRDKGKK